MKENIKTKLTSVRDRYDVLFLTAIMLIGSTFNVSANGDIFDKAATMMNTIYKRIAGITTVTAGCVAAVCLFMMFFSKSQRTVEESTAWLKRIIVIWIAIVCMGAIITFVTSSNGLGVDGTQVQDLPGASPGAVNIDGTV